MKYCKTCKLQYEAPLQNCMFCNNPLEEMDKDTSLETWNYPEYSKIHNYRKSFIRILIFFVIIANIICISTNFVLNNHKLSWSYYVISSTVYGIFAISSILSKDVPFKRIIQLVLWTDVYFLFLGMIRHSYHLCIDYILPSSFLVLAFLSSILLFGKKQRMYDYSIYAAFLSFLSICQLFFYPLNLVDNGVMIIISSIYGIIVLAGILFFHSKMFFEELHRRLHL